MKSTIFKVNDIIALKSCIIFYLSFMWLAELGDSILDYYLNGKLKKRYQYWILPQVGLVGCRKIAIAPGLAKPKRPIYAYRTIHALHAKRSWIKTWEENVLAEEEESASRSSLFSGVTA